MKTSIAQGICAAITGSSAARGTVPRSLVAVAGCVAVAGLAALARMLPVLEDEMTALAVEQGWLDREGTL